MVTTGDPVRDGIVASLARPGSNITGVTASGQALDTKRLDAGGVMFYAAGLVGLYREAAIYADRILKGARPGDLPVEQPTKLELVINFRTARALGLTLLPSVLLRADRVIGL